MDMSSELTTLFHDPVFVIVGCIGLFIAAIVGGIKK